MKTIRWMLLACVLALNSWAAEKPKNVVCENGKCRILPLDADTGREPTVGGPKGPIKSKYGVVPGVDSAGGVVVAHQEKTAVEIQAEAIATVKAQVKKYRDALACETDPKAAKHYRETLESYENGVATMEANLEKLKADLAASKPQTAAKN